jgi:hypothetical protein
MEKSIQFDAFYDGALLESAARIAVHRWYRKHIGLFGSACAVNIIGFAVFLKFAGFTVMVGPLAAVAFGPPIYFAWVYFQRPRKLAARLTRELAPSARVTVDTSGLVLSARSRAVTTGWGAFRDFVECPEYFLLFPSSIAVVVISKKGAPDEALRLVREAGKLYGRSA